MQRPKQRSHLNNYIYIGYFLFSWGHQDGSICGNYCEVKSAVNNISCLHTGADEEYIYMNKVAVGGKDKDDKGVSFKWFLSEVWNL